MSHPVLAGIDSSERSLAAADWAAREALSRGVPLRLVHASPLLPGDAVPVQAADTLHRMGERMLQRAIADLGARYPDLRARGEQTDNAPAMALLAAARGAGLLVVGARGAGGFDGLAVGSVALRVVAEAACPVVLVPERLVGGFGDGTGVADGAAQVVVGFDAHRPVGEVADFAFSAAEERGARLRVVQAWALPAEAVAPQKLFVTEEDRATWEDQEVLQLSDALRTRQDKYPQVTTRADVVLLHPAEALLNASRGADLLVVGRRTDPQAPEGRLGPVTHAVLHHTRCPVAVVPHAD
ncbi:universal stress protein [Streptomyces cyaneochromogenes]|uniref:Universal stress protein n=1 Tax=Streptomyces cyaneochromogenes TaxID=2496836 RepID=A0A3S9MJZ8_9ACTN|nr:universal stress protein [Streptomyces cyaneochromogenes]AZQ39457.1 universal stress protein [Streptomyces cyaneochromogenes]